MSGVLLGMAVLALFLISSENLHEDISFYGEALSSEK